MIENDTLVDDIYAASWLPELWPRVLDTITQRADAHGSVLVTFNGAATRWIGDPNGTAVVEAFVAGGWDRGSVRAARAAALQYPGFINDLDIFSADEIEREPVYRDFFRKLGLGWCIGTTMFAPSGDLLVLNVERRYDRGPMPKDQVRRFDPLRPHLARAALMSSRLQLERATTTTRTLELIGLPAAVVAANDAVLATNVLFERLAPRVIARAFGRIGLSDRNADRLLREAIGTLSVHGAGSIRSIPVMADDELPPLIVHLVPVRREAHDIFGRALGIVVVTPIVPGTNLPSALLQGLFDLSPAESAVAKLIGEGTSIDDAGSMLGVARETVRHHLKAVFSKTGTSRQAELVALLAGKAVPMPDR
jgi:DNA-binding CsgD family transcriptional regulator